MQDKTHSVVVAALVALTVSTATSGTAAFLGQTAGEPMHTDAAAPQPVMQQQPMPSNTADMHMESAGTFQANQQLAPESMTRGMEGASSGYQQGGFQSGGFHMDGPGMMGGQDGGGGAGMPQFNIQGNFGQGMMGDHGGQFPGQGNGAFHNQAQFNSPRFGEGGNGPSGNRGFSGQDWMKEGSGPQGGNYGNFAKEMERKITEGAVQDKMRQYFGAGNQGMGSRSQGGGDHGSAGPSGRMQQGFGGPGGGGMGMPSFGQGSPGGFGSMGGGNFGEMFGQTQGGGKPGSMHQMKLPELNLDEDSAPAVDSETIAKIQKAEAAIDKEYVALTAAWQKLEPKVTAQKITTAALKQLKSWGQRANKLLARIGNTSTQIGPYCELGIEEIDSVCTDLGETEDELETQLEAASEIFQANQKSSKKK